MNARLTVVARPGKVLPIPRGINPLRVDVAWQGQRKTLQEWGAEGGLKPKTVKVNARVRPWPNLVTRRPPLGTRVQWNGAEVRLRDLLRQHGVAVGTYMARRYMGWSLREAVLGRPRARKYQHHGVRQPAHLETVRALFERHLIEHPGGHWEMDYPESIKTFAWMANGRRVRLVHRTAAWVLYRGDVEPGQLFEPTCGKSWCVHPEHLKPRKTTANKEAA